MSKRLMYVAAICGAPAAGACDDFGSGTTEVRVSNVSTVSFDRVWFYTEDGLEEYTDLTPGASTEFLTVSLTYSSATTQVAVGPDTVRLQVIDRVGDTPLDAGRYSYLLVLTGPPGQRQLGQMLRRER